GERAAEAVAGDGDLAARAIAEEGDRAGDFLDRLAEVERLHHLAGLVGVLGELAVIEVGHDRGEAGGGVALGDGLDLVVDAPPLLDDDDTGRLTGAIGRRQDAARFACTGWKGHPLRVRHVPLILRAMSGPKGARGRRFEGALDPVAAALNASIEFDRRLLPHDVAGAVAHAEMLAGAGVIRAAEARGGAAGLLGRGG